MLPARNRHRVHEEAPGVLSAGRIVYETLEADDCRNRRARCDLRRRELLPDGQTQLIETHCLPRGEIPCDELEVRRPAPHVQRLRQCHRRGRVVAGGDAGTGVDDLPLEALGVDRLWLDREAISPGNGLDQVGVRIRERAP